MRTLLILVLALTAGAGPARAWLDSLQVIPAEPVAGEPAQLLVTGYVPDSCWSVLGHACSGAVGQEVVFTVDTYDCEGRGCELCLAVLLPFSLSCEVVFPAEGTYLVRATENADSLRPRFILDLVLNVDVTGPVAAAGVSWAAIKCLYR
jgi:hypothetical protein